MGDISIPSNLARVPNQLASSIVLSAIGGTSRQLLNTQIQLATGLAINRPSDDAVGTGRIAVLDDVIERRDQRLRNLSHADSVLANVDAALGDASEIILEAGSIGLSQIGIGSDETTRSNQAAVINSMIDSLNAIANRQYQDMYLFGGTATRAEPFGGLLGGLQYRGSGDGLATDLGLSRSVAITMSGGEAFGALSARVQGDRDLNPDMVANTKLADLNGARGLGVALSSINVDVNGTDLTVDLTTAHRVGDIISLVEAEIQTVDPGATVEIDAATGDRFRITPSAGVTVTISDLGADAAAADLGLAGTYPPGGAAGSDVDPSLTVLSPVSALSGVTVPLGTLRLENAGQVRDVDLSGAENIEDIMNAVAGVGLGIRVEIAESGDRLNFINELSGANMSVGEVGGGMTATELGVRSLTTSTRLADFNDGRGVGIITGSVDPLTGLPDPAGDRDFSVTLKDGRSFDVDLAGAADVQDVLDAINAAAGAAGLLPAEFSAGLAQTGNGIELTDNTAGTDTVIAALNGSSASFDLGLHGSHAGATITGEDRATVAVDSVFTHLIALRDALLADDTDGISLATDKLQQDVTRLAEARATAGVRMQRVVQATVREEDLRLQDIGLRSEVQDLDYAEAAIRFSSLQQQLQAGLQTGSQALQLSLLDFLR